MVPSSSTISTLAGADGFDTAMGRSTPRAGSSRQQLAGIHDAGGIQRPLDRTHEFELHRAFIPREFAALELADAVLGTAGASMLADTVVDQLVDGGLQRQEFGLAVADGAADVVMQVAVAQMAED